MKKNIGFIVLLSLFILGCSVESQPIEYGKDACHFCRMNIVDKQHAAEIVTKKGKVFKFDAIECMVEFTKKEGDQNVALFLCNDYDDPTTLIDATQATFLISEHLPSPMGANLTGFKTEIGAHKIHADKGGKLLQWAALKGAVIMPEVNY